MKLPEMYNGVKLSDSLLGSPDLPKKYKVHDDVELTKNQENAIDVLPKETFYSNIKRVDGEQQTETCFAKMRWEESRDKEKDEEGKESFAIFDKATNTIDLSKKKATEIKANQRVKLVDPDCDDEKEIKRDFLKVKILETYDRYIEMNCTKNGEIRNSNKEDDANPIRPLNEIKKRVVDKELMVVDTDKINKISVMKGETYLVSMEEHHKMDKEIDKKEVNKI